MIPKQISFTFLVTVQCSLNSITKVLPDDRAEYDGGTKAMATQILYTGASILMFLLIVCIIYLKIRQRCRNEK